MRGRERREVDRVQAVAARDEELVVLLEQERQAAAGAAGGAEEIRLDRVLERQAEARSVADHLDETAARGLAAGVQTLGFLAWAVVAGLVVTIVVGVVGGYARMIDGLARPR